MEKFSALSFYEIGERLALLDSVLEGDESNGAAEKKNFKDGGAASKAFLEIKENCRKIGLAIAMKCIDGIIEQGLRGTTTEELIHSMTELNRIIKWEMEDRLFTYVPPDQASRYDQKELFGQNVNAKFPNIQFDLVEAGNCYALGRGTAVVFHLMRIMETGVKEFGTTIGIALADEKNWQNILDEVNKKIKVLPPKDPATVKISQASANLYAVKLAWRNEVMHPKGTYTLEEADNLIRQVKIFMEQLATII
jgi:hypothetical protein